MQPGVVWLSGDSRAGQAQPQPSSSVSFLWLSRVAGPGPPLTQAIHTHVFSQRTLFTLLPPSQGVLLGGGSSFPLPGQLSVLTCRYLSLWGGGPHLS